MGTQTKNPAFVTPNSHKSRVALDKADKAEWSWFYLRGINEKGRTTTTSYDEADWILQLQHRTNQRSQVTETAVTVGERGEGKNRQGDTCFTITEGCSGLLWDKRKAGTRTHIAFIGVWVLHMHFNLWAHKQTTGRRTQHDASAGQMGFGGSKMEGWSIFYLYFLLFFLFVFISSLSLFSFSSPWEIP